MTGTTFTVTDLAGWLRTYAELVVTHEDELTALDAAIGDGDHGANMVRGLRAVVAVLDTQQFTTLDALAKKVGMTLVSSVGGAAGPLYGTFWLRFGAALPGAEQADAALLGAALHAGIEGVRQRGRAEARDSTMLDALLPGAEAYDAAVAAGATWRSAIAAAAQAAEAGSTGTIQLVARKGRASYLGERSVGHQDPGATSAALLLRAASELP